MNDFLVELGAHPTARQAIKKIGLPLSLPQKLKRSQSPWDEHPLADLPVFVHHSKEAQLAPYLGRFLGKLGADITVFGDVQKAAPYQDCGEAYGRPTRTEPLADSKPYGLIFDATGIEEPSALKSVYEFLQPWLRPLHTCGRVVLLSRPPASLSSPAAVAAARALDGLVRSLAREIGGKGATASRVVVDKGAEANLEAVVGFLMSERSAYVSGQTLHVTGKVAPLEKVPYRKPLEEKVALVTGGARGIGAAIAKSLAREGAHVVLMDRLQEETAVGKLAHELGGTMLLLDLTDPEAPQRLCELFDKNFKGGLDIIIHNAGITRDKKLANMKPELWDQVLDVNLISLMRVNEALLPQLREEGRIVCVSSVAGISGNMGQTQYAATKAGLIGYVQALAPSLADRRITMNAVAPGFIETKMTAAMPVATREVGRRLSNLVQGGLPEDVAEAVMFLASPGATGMTGEVLRICGGSYLGA